MENVDDVYPLTPTQSGILFHALRDDDPESYLEQVRFDLRGPLDIDALRSSLDRVVRTHAMLRTMFVWDVGSRPLQVVRSEVQLPLTVDDRRLDPPPPDEIDRWAAESRGRGIRLDAAPAFRVELLLLDDDRAHLCWTSHHVVLDGWSSAAVFDEWFETYEQIVAGCAPERPPDAPGFRDYVAWLRARDDADARTHWRTTFAGLREPTTVHRLPVRSPGIGRERLTRSLSSEDTAALHDRCRRLRVTTSVAVAGVWGLVAATQNGRADVVIGATSSGRPPELPGVERIVGMFSTTVPMRIRYDDDVPIATWLAALQRQQLDGQPYEHLALSGIRREIELDPGAPLFETAIVYENYPIGRPGPAPSLDRRLAATFDRSHLPLELMVLPGSEGLTFAATYDSARSDEAVVELLLDQLVSGLIALAGDAETSVGGLVAQIGSCPASGPTPAPPDALPGSRRGSIVELLGAEWAAVGEHLTVADAANLQALATPTGHRIVQVPSEVADDVARLVRFCARRRVQGWCVTGDQLAAVVRRFPEIARRLPDLRVGTVVGRVPADTMTATHLAFGEQVRWTWAAWLDADHADGIACPPPDTVARPALVELAQRLPPLGQVGPSDLPRPIDGSRFETVDERGAVLRPGVAGDVRIAHPDGTATALGRRGRVHVDGSVRFLDDTCAPRADEVGSSRDVGGPAEPEAIDEAHASDDTPSDTFDDLVARLSELWRTRLGLTEVDPDADLFDLGGRSSDAVELFADIRDEFGIDLPLAVLFRHPTVRSLAGLIERGGVDDRSETERTRRYAGRTWLHLVEIEAGEPGRTPFIAVHGAGGNVLNLRRLSQELGPQIPFYGLQAAGVDGIQPMHRTLDEMATDYVAEVRELQPHGPYVLAGYSGGGVVALRMARQLADAGDHVSSVILFDTYHPSLHPLPARWRTHARELVRTDDGVRRSPTDALEQVRTRLRSRRSRQDDIEARRAVVRAADAHDQLVPFEVRDPELSQHLYDLIHAVDVVGFDGPVTILAADDVPEQWRHVPHDRGWSHLLPDVRVVDVSGSHQVLLDPPHVSRVGDIVRSMLLELDGIDDGNQHTTSAATRAEAPRDAERSSGGHVFRHAEARPVEQRVFDATVRPGDRVLDVGTAATGRSALALRDHGAEVHSIELVGAALREFAELGEPGIELVCAEVQALPYADSSFDAVVVAFHGLDYLTDRADRRHALREMTRVLRPGGVLVFDAFNRIGLVTNPGIWRTSAGRRLVGRHLATGRPMRRTFIDANGLELHHASPSAVVREVERVTPLRLERVWTTRADHTSRWAISALDPEPHYTFRAPAPDS